MRIVIISIILILILPNFAYSATVKGSVYDFSLNKIKNTIVEINSVPIQKVVSRDGTYSLNVPPGKYNITTKAPSRIVIAQESIEIKEEGIYTIDLFVFQELTENEDLLEDLDLEIEPIDEEGTNYLIQGIIIIAILIMIILLLKYLKGRKKETIEKQEVIEEQKEIEELPNKVVEIIKKSEGRMTQKELRKHFPLSEAKISLVLTELEAKGKIEKIKKGRGNVIILKKS